MSKFLPIGERLREERERLGLNQADFAAIGGSTRKTQYNYEAGERAPDGGFLAAIAAVGVDVLYILTGNRANHAAEQNPGYTVLNREEAALLDNFRHIADQEDKSAVTKLALRSAEAATREETQPRTKKKSG